MARGQLSEREVLTAAARALRATGEVSLDQAIPAADLAERGSRVDLVYTPLEGPLRGVRHFVEYVPSSSTALPAVALAIPVRQLARLRRQGQHLRYIVATRSEVREDLLDGDLPEDMTIIGGIDDGEQLASYLQALAMKPAEELGRVGA